MKPTTDNTLHYLVLRAAGVLLLLTPAAAIPWTPGSFPDPTQDVWKCGREGRTSRVCDPDGILSLSVANAVEGILKEIVTPVPPYSAAPCQGLQAGAQGFQVGVALMQKMGLEGQAPEQAAAAFADKLFQKWGVGDSVCGNGAVLLLAIEDRQVFITAGTGMLSPHQIKSITGRMRPLLKAGQYGEAVQAGVVNIGIGFAQHQRGDHEHEGESSNIAGLIVAALAFPVVGLLIWLSRRKQSRERTAVQRMLDKLKREQEHARRTGRYPAASCPICLNDFPPSQTSPSTGHASASADKDADDARPSAPPLGSPSKGQRYSEGQAEQPLLGSYRSGGAAASTPAQEFAQRPLALPCGHTFCEACISSWLGAHTTCPICRQPATGDAAPRPPPPACQRARADVYDLELDYRLNAMSRLYPHIVTQSVLDDLHRQAHQGTLVDWSSFRASETTIDAQRHHAQSGDQGSGWGFSGGSGGGHSTVGGGGTW